VAAHHNVEPTTNISRLPSRSYKTCPLCVSPMSCSWSWNRASKLQTEIDCSPGYSRQHGRSRTTSMKLQIYPTNTHSTISKKTLESHWYRYTVIPLIASALAHRCLPVKTRDGIPGVPFSVVTIDSFEVEMRAPGPDISLPTFIPNTGDRNSAAINKDFNDLTDDLTDGISDDDSSDHDLHGLTTFGETNKALWYRERLGSIVDGLPLCKISICTACQLLRCTRSSKYPTFRPHKATRGT
jgi:hypothetical protein